MKARRGGPCSNHGEGAEFFSAPYGLFLSDPPGSVRRMFRPRRTRRPGRASDIGGRPECPAGLCSRLVPFDWSANHQSEQISLFLFFSRPLALRYIPSHWTDY